MNSFREENSEDRLAQLYQLLGSAVLLPVDLGTKAPTLKGWQAITFDDTQHPDYQRELLAVIRRGGNLGVRLGPLSDRLIDLDIDNDGELDNLIKRCPWLTGTLQTKGQRGRHFFVRLSGDCEFPNGKSVYPLTEGSKKIGELRLGGSGGAQSVIYGVHPDGMRYQILVNRPPLVISLADLDELAPGVIFKDDIVPTRPAATHTAVAKTEASQKPGNVDVVKRARAYLAAMPPSVEKQNGDDQLFKAACVLVNGYNLSPEEALPILEEYNSRAEPRWPEQRLRYKLSEALKVGPPAGKMRGYLLDDTDRQPSQGKIFGEKLAREFQEAEGGSNRQLEADNNLPLDLEKETERQIERYTSDPELFPEPMRPEAFHGVIGQIAQLMSQHCESSLEVLLLHGLVIIGNIAGRSAYVYGGGPKLFPNEFSVFVGETARGRKGTAYTMWEHLAQMVNPDWFEGCLSGQMQTGEGIVHRIRDERYGIPLGKKKKGEPVEEVLLDAGVSDKRLLIVEEEFSHSLKMAQRNGNTLSETVRRAWDSPHSLRTDNKNSPLKASDPHVSLIGHSTRDELLTTLGKG